MAKDVIDDFSGSNDSLCRNIRALIALNDDGVLMTLLSGNTRILLASACVRLESMNATSFRHTPPMADINKQETVTCSFCRTAHWAPADYCMECGVHI